MFIARWILIAAPLAALADARAQTDTIVRMAGPPRHAGVATFAEEVSIGVVSGTDAYMFGDVSDLAVAKDGSILVMDRSLNVIRTYDSAGRHVRTIGGRGQGPGEIGAASGMVVLADGRLLLYDSGNARINVYSPSGAHLTQWRLPAGSSGGRDLVADTAGFVYVRKSARTAVSATRVLEVWHHWLRLRVADGMIADTIAEPDWPPYVEPLIASNPPRRTQMAMPFTPGRYVTISPLGVMVSGLADRYAFEIRSRGRPTISIRRNIAPTPVTTTERAQHRERLETRLRQTDPQWSWGGRDIPRTKPVYVDLAAGLDGRIWVTLEKSPVAARPRNTAGRAGAGASAAPLAPGDSIVERPTILDVFEPDGAYIGRVQTPLRVSLMAMRGDHVWGVARDEDDVQLVKRYRIVWR